MCSHLWIHGKWLQILRMQLHLNPLICPWPSLRSQMFQLLLFPCYRYWEFVTGLYDSIPDLVSIIELSCLVFLDDTQRFCLYLLISCKTFSAFVTLSSSTDRIVVFCRSGIYDSGILTSTIWASHLLVPPCFYCLKYIIFFVEKKAFLLFQAFFFVDID